MQNEEHLKFTQTCMEALTALSPLLARCLLAARKELDLELSEEWYLELTESSSAAGKEIFQRFLEDLKIKMAVEE